MTEEDDSGGPLPGRLMPATVRAVIRRHPVIAPDATPGLSRTNVFLPTSASDRPHAEGASAEMPGPTKPGMSWLDFCLGRSASRAAKKLHAEYRAGSGRTAVVHGSTTASSGAVAAPGRTTMVGGVGGGAGGLARGDHFGLSREHREESSRQGHASFGQAAAGGGAGNAAHQCRVRGGAANPGTEAISRRKRSPYPGPPPGFMVSPGCLTLGAGEEVPRVPRGGRRFPAPLV